MMNPKAKLIASRSASVTAGTALPASVRVAITEPGPTRTNAAVPKVSASARCGIECISFSDPPVYLTCVRQCRTDFTNRSLLQTVCQQLIWAVHPMRTPAPPQLSPRHQRAPRDLVPTASDHGLAL